VAALGQALAASPARGQLHELMANLAAYTGLRWGELAALTMAQIDPAARVITVDRKVVEIGGQLFTEAPKNRKRRRTIYPRRTPRPIRWPRWSPPGPSRPPPSKRTAPTHWG
jgi:integrase